MFDSRLFGIVKVDKSENEICIHYYGSVEGNSIIETAHGNYVSIGVHNKYLVGLFELPPRVIFIMPLNRCLFTNSWHLCNYTVANL